VAYYANYLVWFEVGRSELCRKRGFCYSDLEALGFKLVVTDVQCRYRSSAKYDELITIRTWVPESNKRLITFGYQILRNGGEEVIAEGESRHLCLDSKGKPKSLPEKFVQCLAGREK
jgi:acyl-CoA thioester hydrolase